MALNGTVNNKFKHGDVVSCIIPRDNLLLNEEYTIENVYPSNDLWYCHVKGFRSGYSQHRFELIENVKTIDDYL